MKIDVQRLAKLAGISGGTSSMLSEGKGHGKDAEQLPKDANELDIEEMEAKGDLEEEIFEIDEKMLVQELRRAKSLIAEAKQTKENLQEAELKSIISSEISNVLKDLNLNSSWVYGGNKPKRSRPGHTAQGSYLKGIGFK